MLFIFFNIYLPLLFEVLLYLYTLRAIVSSFVSVSFLIQIVFSIKFTTCFAFKLRSTLHRVIGNGQERYSVSPTPYFSLIADCKALLHLLSEFGNFNNIFKYLLSAIPENPVQFSNRCLHASFYNFQHTKLVKLNGDLLNPMLFLFTDCVFLGAWS